MSIEHVAVERESKDSLTLWRWQFWYDHRVLWLNSYEELQRPTRRHGFKHTQSFSRLDKRNNSLQESDVVIHADVAEEAIKKYCEGITVKRWSERHDHD